jgi:adenosylcobinamide-GDP ribazoletransferase
MSDIRLGLLLAFSYFSFIPIKIREYRISKEINRYLLSFVPFVGFFLGAISIGCYYFFTLFFESFFSAILVSAIYLLLYGFLHLEAICDVVDGYFASFSNKDVHTIMKEPTVGAMGIIAIVVFLILKISAIVYLFYQEKVLLFLVAVTFSRLSVHYILMFFDFHTDSKIALTFKSILDFRLLIIVTLVYFVLLLSVLELSYLLLLFISMLIFSFYIVSRLEVRLGFVNGDLLGFNIEMSELFLLIGLLAI